MAKKTNWDRLQDARPEDTLRNRDVYEDQQLERSQIQEKISPTGRIIFTAIVAVFVALLMYFFISVLGYAKDGFGPLFSSDGTSSTSTTEVGEVPADVIVESYTMNGIRYFVDEDKDGNPDGEEYTSEQDAREEYKAKHPEMFYEVTETTETDGVTIGEEKSEQRNLAYYLRPTLLKVFISLVSGLLVFLIMYEVMMRNLKAQNMLADTSDINQYQNDQHIALPEEVMQKFDWFPDVGAHSSVTFSSMISHVALQNKGLKTVQVSQRAEKDIVDEDGDIVYYKGEVLFDDDGNPISKTMPMIDEKFMDDLFTASGLPQDKKFRKYYDATKIPYNPGGTDREKLGAFDTVADLINTDWDFPYYETQRPAGAYLVDVAPVNTMVLAITRAGKGQTVIEPTLDMWTREKNPNNMVVNDPKGELLVKFYVRATVRGFQIVQFNLINAMKTDIYNPLTLASESAREGDFTKTAMYVENIADVFFPLDGGDDPVWPNAANNAFKRAAYGLIDYYLEEEKELRLHAERTGMEPKILEGQVDRMWGKVTLYNTYQLFVQLTAKKLKNPAVEFTKRAKNGEFDNISDEEYNILLDEAERKSKLWEDRPETDLLSLYFNATDALPKNSMRTLVGNANNALKAMAGAEKMMASVYGIAITAMSFFTDPTISTLTSGTPSQNADFAGISFPRMFGVRFHSDFLKRYHLIGMQAKWDSFEDENFTKDMGKEFYHEDLISREGWAKYYFKGKYPTDIAYVRLRIMNPQTGMLIRTLYFRFNKSYQTSLDGRYYVTDPVLGDKIVKNGLLTELKQFKKKDGSIVFKEAKTVFPNVKIQNIMDGNTKKEKIEQNAIIATQVRYSEKPKMIFLVTPPHLMKYAKLILILVKQLVDLNFDRSYMTKSNQKPLYKTRFMLDELGNLQSEGHGIQGFATMLSIGLGQEQQFTLILQTLQQLRDVYGDSVDKIVQGNANWIYSKIATPNGWKEMKDIQVGDYVYAANGLPTKVLGVYPKGVRPVYKVTLRDGSSTLVCNQHLWEVERWKTSLAYTGERDEYGRRKYVGTGPNGATCEKISEVIDTDEMLERFNRGMEMDLPMIKPVSYPERELPIDPYVLGVLLGDANIDEKGLTTLTCSDEEIISRLEEKGIEVTLSSVQEGKAPVYYVKGVNRIMKSLGLAGHRAWEKFIPNDYKFGSIEQRIDLLRGLMDSDGYISEKSEMEFVSTSEVLAKDVQELIRSLGGRVAINEKMDVYYTSPNQKTKKKARTAFRVQNIRLPEINPFYLSRKAERWHERKSTGSGNFGNRIVNIEYMFDDLVQCIMVEDERHLFITDDYIPTHNTSNIVFLKSTDDSMLDTLQKMSGTTHRSFTDSKTITRDMERIWMQNEGKASYTMTTREVPVISYNDMAFIAERNSIVFRAGDSPVWNRNETILPMSWRLFKDTIEHPGHEYTLQTIPTLSSAIDFDVRQNQPDFQKMLNKRMTQAFVAAECCEFYQNAYGYTDYEIEQLDPDTYSEEIMDVINQYIKKKDADSADEMEDDDWDYDEQFGEDFFGEAEDNTEEQQAAIAKAQADFVQSDKKIFAGNQLSPADFIAAGGYPNHGYDKMLINAYINVKGYMEQDTEYFSMRNGELCSPEGEVYIRKLDESEYLSELNRIAKEKGSRVFQDEGVDVNDLKAIGNYEVTDAFYRFLAGQNTWSFAKGEFEKEMARQVLDA